jgi:transposase
VIARERRLQACRGLEVRVMFQDEGRFGRINTPRRCWAPPGARPVVGSQRVRESTYAYVAVSPADGTMVSLGLPETNTEMMSLFLGEVARRHPDEFVVMFMDQAGWHRSGALWVPPRMRLRWLPPYSPECNPSEHVWEEIREKWFGNRVFESLEEVESTLGVALAALEDAPDRIQSLTGFEWALVSL